MNFFSKKEKEAPTPVIKTGRRVKNDIVLIVSLLVLISIAALALFLFRAAGDTVVVTVDGKTFGTYSLREDRTVEIRSGEGYNLLVIEGGHAYVKEASCPDGICSSHRPVSHDGESIICLPNRVVVEIRAESGETPDIIA